VLGKRAGSIQLNGYRYIHYEGVNYKANRLAWMFYYGEEPPEGIFVDHINRVKSDDKICNLRLATRGQNCANMNRVMRGVYKRGRKWRAQLGVTGHIGTFGSREEAYEAVKQAHTAHYGEFSPCE
jgi:hypothetical protein